MIFKCKEVSKLVSDGLHTKLPLMTRLRLYLHLRMCNMCSAYKQQIEWIHHSIKQLNDNLTQHSSSLPPLDSEAKVRIKKAIDREVEKQNTKH